MKSIKEKFIKDFDRNEANKLESAAIEHKNGINNKNTGKDFFKWVLLICIGYQCFEKERYRQYHKIKTPFNTLKAWIKKHGHLDTHNGDCDYIALMAGAYNDYMPKNKIK